MITDTVSRTIKCDNPDCTNAITFDPQNPEAVAALPTWLRTLRNVQLGNRQSFTYCSDVCEVKGVTTGQHNIPEPPQVQPAQPGDVKKVAAQAEQVNQLRQDNQEKKVTLS
jgi:hypothetical protein